VTIDGPVEVVTIVKNSKFIARAFPAKNIEAALSFYESVKEAKASHNCWAYRTSSLPPYERFSDDGEPGGTAGRPILGALESEGIYDCVVVVTRYFGGVKLGTGGLVRAYASSAREVLKAAKKLEIIPMCSLRISVPIAYVGQVYQFMSTSPEITRLSETYADDSRSVFIDIQVPVESRNSVEVKLIDACRGSATVGELY
jgi:uncharacterized YigZ family protein